MMTENEVGYVNASIEAVVSQFKRIPNAFLTEDDLRVHLCSKLLEYFGEEQNTQDGDKSISLHSEVRWYGNGELKSRSDIVLVDVSTLNVLRYDEMPTKGYGFNSPKAIIELKLRRPVGDANTGFLNEIQNDVAKLNILKDVFRDCETKYWMVVLDKMEAIAPETLGFPHAGMKDEIFFRYVFACQLSHCDRQLEQLG